MERSRREAAVLLLAAGAAALVPGRGYASTGMALEGPTGIPLTGPPLTGPQTGAPALGAPDAPDPVQGSVAVANDPFEHLTAPVMINGHGPYPFVVDTGASISCVARGLAEQLGLPIEEKRQLHTVVGVKTAPMALVDELRIGVRRSRRMSALAIPIEEPGIQGVLAVDWLHDQRLTLNFVTSNLEFAASRGEQSEPGRVVVPARRRWGQLTIVDAELGDRKVSAMVDSGSQVSLCNTSLLSLLDRSQVKGPRRELVQMISVIGEPFSGELVYLPFLRLGGLQLGNVAVVHSDAHAFAIWGLADKPAILLGMDLLRQFRAVSLDFGRSQVRFDLSDAQV
jgi:predicted aspartyl protease